MRSKLTLVSFGLIVAFAAVPALAAVVPLTDNRPIECNATAEDPFDFGSDSDWNSGSDFSPFQSGVSSDFYFDSVTCSGSAHQTSTIEPLLFDINGGCAANAESWGEEAYGEAFGSTQFMVTFEVTVATDFTLIGWLEASDNGQAWLYFSGPGIDLFHDAGFDNILEIYENGTLAPGVYSIDIMANSQAGAYPYEFSYAYGGFDLDLAFAGPSPVTDPFADELAMSLSPNPFSGRTQVAYASSSSAPVNLEIFDVRGRKVRSLVTTGASAGNLIWDGRDGQGREVAPGVFFMVLRSGDSVRREKVTLVR